MNFDWTIDLRTMLELFTFIGAGISILYALRTEVKVIKVELGALGEKVETVTAAITPLTSILTTLAAQHERLNALDKRVDELSHGRGYIRD